MAVVLRDIFFVTLEEIVDKVTDLRAVGRALALVVLTANWVFATQQVFTGQSFNFIEVFLISHLHNLLVLR